MEFFSNTDALQTLTNPYAPINGSLDFPEERGSQKGCGDPDNSEMPAHAAADAKRGWHVFPVWWVREHGTCACGNSDCNNVGKHPIGSLAPNGLKNATTDLAAISRWWARYPNANIGIATGPSKLLVVDIDTRPDKGKDGTALWQGLQEELGAAPATLEQVTGSGGRHLIFDRGCHEGKIKSSSRDGLDVRADGGYIVVAPRRPAPRHDKDAESHNDARSC